MSLSPPGRHQGSDKGWDKMEESSRSMSSMEGYNRHLILVGIKGVMRAYEKEHYDKEKNL